MTELVIRQVNPTDIGGVERIENASFTDPYPTSLLLALALSNPSTFLVATLKGEVIGYASATIEGGDSAHLASVAIDPAYRERGVAKQLLESLLSTLRRRGISHVKLEVRESNLAAQKLYLSIGFQHHHRVKNYYEDGEGAAVMILHLR
jgi:ribosomal-protein-alanine N-acetyltransferase